MALEHSEHISFSFTSNAIFLGCVGGDKLYKFKIFKPFHFKLSK